MHQSFSSLRVLRASVRDPLNALCGSHRDANNDVLRIPWAAISEFRFKQAVFNRLGEAALGKRRSLGVKGRVLVVSEWRGKGRAGLRHTHRTGGCAFDHFAPLFLRAFQIGGF